MSDFLNKIADFSPKRLLLLAAELDERVRALESELAEKEVDHTHDPIAIIGMGCRFPGGADSPSQFWELLEQGRDAITEVPSWRWSLDELYDPDPHAKGKVATRWGGFLEAPESFDAAFFGIAPIEAVSMDPQQRLLLEVTWEALEDAGIAPIRLNGSKTGVYIGLCNSDYGQIVMNDSPAGLDAYFATGASHSVAAGRISYFLGLRGPSMAIDTACSASLVSVHEACQGLRLGESDLAVAGGVNLVLVPEVTMALSRAQMMSPDGRCKAFSAKANGFVRSEGCGIVVLKRLADAEREGDRILAVIRGTAINQDGRSSGLTAPNGPSQVEVIRAALRDGGLGPEAVSYVEAHGTGTALGDTIEMQALGEALGKHQTSGQLAVGSVKSNFGHTESAAGVAGLIKLVLALQNKIIPPSLHSQEPNPAIDWAKTQTRVPVVAESWSTTASQPIRIGAVSSFGFSGTNAHLIVSEPPQRISAVEVDPPALPLLLSARSKTALQTMAKELATHLARNPHLRLADITYTLASGRSAFPHRLGLRAQSTAQLIEEFSIRADDSDGIYGLSSGRAPRVAFLFAGQGGEHTGMGLTLLQHSPVFRDAIDEVDVALAGAIPRSIESIFRNEQDQLSHSAFVQPALFAFQYGLARCWQALGIEPSIVAGHSMGEIVAATIAEVLSLQDAVRLIVARGRLTEELADPGGMVAIAASQAQVESVLNKYRHDVSIAVMNGPNSLVISGRTESLEEATQEFEALGIRVKRLNITYGSHSPAMDRVLAPFHEEAARLTYQAPAIPIVADLTGKRVEDDSVLNAEYWTRHLSSPILFGRCLESLQHDGASLYIEMGPRNVLTAFGREFNDRTATWIASANGQEDDFIALQAAIAAAFVAGASPDGKAIHTGVERQLVSLPTYPFERERFWPTERSSDPAKQRVPKGQSPGSRRDESAAEDSPAASKDWLYKQSWESRPLLHSGAIEARKWIVLGDANGLAGRVQQLLNLSGQDVELVRDLRRFDRTASLPLGIEYVDLRTLGPLEQENAGSIQARQFPAEELGARTVALTAQSYDLWQHAIRNASRLWLFTSGTQLDREERSVENLIQAPLWGLARCATLEQPQILRRIVDLDPLLALKEQASIIVREILSRDEEEQVAYERTSRLVFRIQREQAPDRDAEKSSALRSDGAYLVTGGLGGLGLTVAGWLADQGVQKIVLTTRSLSSIEAAQAQLDALRSRGIDVEAVQADVTDRHAMAQLMARFGNEKNWPALRGVFHLAMSTPVPDDGPVDHSVLGIQAAQLEAIFASKVTGTCLLRELTRDLGLDFLVAFSTTSSLIGARHLSHYAAANSFVDAIANFHEPHHPRLLAINWGQWNTMRLAPEKFRQHYTAGGLLPMDDALALEWLGRLLNNHNYQPVVANIDWQLLGPVYESKRRRSWLEHLRDLGVDKSSDATPVLSSVKKLDSLEDLELAIRQEAARVLGLRRGALPDRHAVLADLGLDSLMAVTLRNRLQMLAGHSLPSTFAFEHPTSSQMAVALDLLRWGTEGANHGSEVAQVELKPDGSPELIKDQERDEIQI